MSTFKLKATHTPVKAYYETLEKFGRGKFDNEGNIRRAFESLLEKCARPFEWLVGQVVTVSVETVKLVRELEKVACVAPDESGGIPRRPSSV
jgi:hypothetical protein